MALAQLNLDNVQMAGARQQIDPVMRQLVDMLDDTYDGTPTADGKTRQANGWEHGVSHPFFIWDKEATLDKSKLKFDLLSGIIHHLTFLAQHMFNCAEAAKYPEVRYNEVRDDTGTLIETRVRSVKRYIASSIVIYNDAALLPVMNKTRRDSIITWIKNRPVVDALIKTRAAVATVLDPDSTVDIT